MRDGGGEGLRVVWKKGDGREWGMGGGGGREDNSEWDDVKMWNAWKG